MNGFIKLPLIANFDEHDEVEYDRTAYVQAASIRAVYPYQQSEWIPRSGDKPSHNRYTAAGTYVVFTGGEEGAIVTSLSMSEVLALIEGAN